MNTHKPLIALTPYHNTEKNELYMRPAYLKAIRAAGGTPVILPLDSEETELSHFVEAFDGFLFTGGPDIHPFFFGEETQRHCGNVSLKRDHMELKLLKTIMDAKTNSWHLSRNSALKYRTGRQHISRSSQSVSGRFPHCPCPAF